MSDKGQTADARAGRWRAADRVLISDIDNTLLGDPAALARLLGRLADTSLSVCFGVATGRHLEITLEVLEEWAVPRPDVLVTAVGAEIYYGSDLAPDQGWADRISRGWEPDRLRQVIAGLPGLRLQAPEHQRLFKISYNVLPGQEFDLTRLENALREQDLLARAIFSHGQFLDILPAGAGKGAAIAYLADRWGWPPGHILVAGDSGNDADMLRGDSLGVVVGNHSAELEGLHGEPRIFFAPGRFAAGICDGLDHYRFLEDETAPGGMDD
jgi:sucrose-phosphate synthase